MALQIIWTVDAKDHVNEILDYWHQRNGSKNYSQKLYQTVKNALKTLAIPIGIWIDRLDCISKNVKIKAKIVDELGSSARLTIQDILLKDEILGQAFCLQDGINDDIYIFNSKISVKSISDWYISRFISYRDRSTYNLCRSISTTLLQDKIISNFAS